MVKRANSEDFLPGYWEQVGGKVEPGETQEEAVVREVQEEAEIVVRPLGSYHQYEYTRADGSVMKEVAYLCEVSGTPHVVLSPEHQKHVWVTQEELSAISPITDTMREVVMRGFTELKQYEADRRTTR